MQVIVSLLGAPKPNKRAGKDPESDGADEICPFDVPLEQQEAEDVVRVAQRDFTPVGGDAEDSLGVPYRSSMAAPLLDAIDRLPFGAIEVQRKRQDRVYFSHWVS